MGKTGKRNKKQKSLWGTILSILLICAMWYLSKYTDVFATEDMQYSKDAKIVDGELEMHIIDVGQGDSILLLQDDKVMLVDAGSKSQASKVVDYLNKLGIKKIDVLVGTHPHEDHMGGMAEVINNFDIGVLYTSYYDDTNINTTYYMNLIEAVANKNVKWRNKKRKDTFKFGEADVEVLAPDQKEYEEVNNYSLVLKISFGETDILLTGDAEELVEKEILNNYKDINCEVLKLGHHGSSSSSSKEFVKAVNPEYVIISAGKGNDYHHPHPSIMSRMKELKVSVYRTDEQGDIVMTTDGKNIEFNKKKGSYKTGDELIGK